MGSEINDKPIILWGKDTPQTEVKWLWKPFIPYGKLCIIQGDGGDGKTSLILKIAAMITRGERPPEMQFGMLSEVTVMEPETVFYASTEEEIADSALPKFRRNGGNDNRFAYSAERNRHLTLNEQDLTNVIEQSGAKLMIIDPLQAFLPKGVNMNNVNRMRPIFTALSNVALTTGAAIVLLGHLNKNESSKDIHRGLGSADIAAAVRSIILVEKIKGAPPKSPRAIRCIKSNFDESDFTPILFRLTDERKIEFMDGVEYVEEPDEPELSPKDRAKIYLTELLSNGPMESNEVKENLDKVEISKRTADRAKAELGIKSIRDAGKTFWVPPEE